MARSTTHPAHRSYALTDLGIAETDRMVRRRARRVIPVPDVVYVPVLNLPPYEGDLHPKRAAS